MDLSLITIIAIAAVSVFAYLAFLHWKKRKAGVRKPTKDDIYPMW